MTGFAQRYRDEGRQEGERRVLERLLQRRFGALSAEDTERLTNASMEDLEKWVSMSIENCRFLTIENCRLLGKCPVVQ